MARSDLERALQLARGFKGESPRANAVIAVARAVLAERTAPPPRAASKD